MSLRNRERIIAPIPPADQRVRGGVISVVVVLFLLSLFIPPFAFAEAEQSLERGVFSGIDFSDSCGKKQWTQMPDNSIELLLAPPLHGVCEAFLHFYTPQEINAGTALALEARSSEPGLFLKIGGQATENSQAYFSRRFPGEGLTTEWTQDAARFYRFRKGWRPTQISTLHLVVLANRNVVHSPASDVVSIRNIRFVQTTPVAEETTPEPAGQPVAAKPDEASKTASPADVAKPSSPAAVSGGSKLTLGIPTVDPRLTAAGDDDTARPRLWAAHLGSVVLSGARWLLLGLAGCLAFVWTTGRIRRRRILSPLYELNTRIWKTHRDAHDVVQFGGFNSIKAADLQSIKDSGFNALWLMGIWEIGAKVRDISKGYAADFHGSPFAIYDYQISSDLGTDAEFRGLVQRAHGERLSVIVDFIPNHMGLDCAWLNDHPEYFIHKPLDPGEGALTDEALKQKHPGYFPYRTPSYPQNGRRVPKTILVAYGKDPYFYPWIDTAQLDYAQPGLRQRMIDVLCQWAKVVDGVRCDMAMLILREQIKIHRHPDMSWDAFNQLMPNEFWSEAIPAVKRVNPNFVFLAETYWSMEGQLQQLGFDYTYNKPLYEAICGALQGGHAEGLMNFLRVLGSDFLHRSVHFLENHDEERAMNTLGDERQRPAAAILCTLPGVTLVHQGQMEGRRERMPVQRVVPVHREAEHTGLNDFYKRLLKVTALPVFQEGRFHPLYSNNPALVTYARVDGDTKVLVIVNTSHKRQAGSVSLMPGLRLHSGTPYRLNDLYYTFKNGALGSTQPFYTYSGAKLINQGLYVDLVPFDAHLFVIEPQGATRATQKWLDAVVQPLGEWPLSRVVRRFSGSSLNRSSDTNLAANPTGRQPQG